MTPAIIGDPSLWAKFGLSGLVIFALFTVMSFMVWFTIKRFDKIDARNTNAAAKQADDHRDERGEWRRTSTQQIDKFEIAITRLADGIRDSRS